MLAQRNDETAGVEANAPNLLVGKCSVLEVDIQENKMAGIPTKSYEFARRALVAGKADLKKPHLQCRGIHNMGGKADRCVQTGQPRRACGVF